MTERDPDGRRRSRLAIVLWLSLLAADAVAGQPEVKDYPSAIALLARERSLAESHAVDLQMAVDRGGLSFKRYAPDIQLYADAKAQFDGLIEQLKFHVRAGQAIAGSRAFDESRERAVEQRLAFTTYVDQQITLGTFGSPRDWVESAAQLGAAMIDAGIKIWHEYRDASKERQQAILAQIEGLKWKPIHEISRQAEKY